VSLGLTRSHFGLNLVSLWSQYASLWSHSFYFFGEGGNVKRGKERKEKVYIVTYLFLPQIWPGKQGARTRNELPVGLAPPTSDKFEIGKTIYIYIYMYLYIYIYIDTNVYPCIYVHGVKWSRLKRNRDMRYRDKHLQTVIRKRNLEHFRTLFERLGGSLHHMCSGCETRNSKPAQSQICGIYALDLWSFAPRSCIFCVCSPNLQRVVHFAVPVNGFVTICATWPETARIGP